LSGRMPFAIMAAIQMTTFYSSIAAFNLFCLLVRSLAPEEGSVTRLWVITVG
jgi:hypothetical protein